MEKVYGVHFFDGFYTKRTDLFNTLSEAKECQNCTLSGPLGKINSVVPIEVISSEERLVKVILDNLNSCYEGIQMNLEYVEFDELVESYICQKRIGWELLQKEQVVSY